MSFLVLAVLCSVLVSVLLKLSPRYRLDIAQMVTWNYAAATLLSLWLLSPSLPLLRHADTPWPALLLLALLLPALFLLLARAVAVAGIARSDVAQRLSLLLSLAAAFVLFGETANAWKLTGLGLGLLAILGIASRPRPQAGQGTHGRRAWPWLLAVWLGFALVDVLLKHIAQAGTPSLTSLSVCFALAFVLMLAWQGIGHVLGHTRFSSRNLVAGLLLGSLNFANILCYVKAHQALPHSPAVVFATMNIGVVALGAAVGMLGFGERISAFNRLGLLLALVAIALIARGTL
jgi:drug/metabolite transporter (DMT)-like permease